MRLAEHEKSSCHLQAGVQWFDAEQRLTKSCLLDSSHHIYHLPRHQTFIVFGCLRVYKTLLQSPGTSTLRAPPAPAPLNEGFSASQLGKAKIVNVIQHTRSCSSYWAAICFYLINEPCALYIAFGSFYLHFVT